MRRVWRELEMGQLRLLIKRGSNLASKHSIEEITELYRNSKCLREIGVKFNLNSKNVRRLLELAEIDFCNDFNQEHLNGKNWSQIAKKHGMKPITLSCVMKSKGYSIVPGRSLKHISPEEIADAIEQETNPWAVAKRLGIHWKTADKHYRKS